MEDAPITQHFKDHPKEPRIMQLPEELRGWSSQNKLLSPMVLTSYLYYGAKHEGGPGGCHAETRMAGVVTSESLAKWKKSNPTYIFLTSVDWPMFIVQQCF